MLFRLKANKLTVIRIEVRRALSFHRKYIIYPAFVLVIYSINKYPIGDNRAKLFARLNGTRAAEGLPIER